MPLFTRPLLAAALALGISLPAFAQSRPSPVQLFSLTGSTGARFAASMACLRNVTAVGETSIAIGDLNTDGPSVRLFSATGSGPLATVFSAQAPVFIGTSIRTMRGDGGIGDSLTDVLAGGPSIARPSVPSQFFMLAGPNFANNLTFTTSVGFSTNVGSDVVSLGVDTDSNSLIDFVVSAPDSGDSGEIFIHDSASITSPIRSLRATQQGELFGASIDTSQDLNGNGFPDILVGSPRRTQTLTLEGAVYAIDSATLSSIWRVDGEQAGVTLGSSVAVVGDVDGNGINDFVAGAPIEDAVAPGIARLYLVTGVNNPTIGCDITAGETGDRFGEKVALLGDIDGDSRPEFAVAAPAANNDQGRVYIYQYDPVTSACPLLHTLEGSPNDLFGSSLAGAPQPGVLCDLNADGIGDFGIGSSGGDGRATFFAGVALPTPTPTATATATPTATATATPTPDASPPSAASLRFRISENGSLLMTHTFNEDPPAAGCTVALYGRTSRIDRTDVRPAFTVSRERRQRTRTYRYRATNLRRAFCDSRGQPYLIHMVTDNRCAGKRFFSNVFARHMSCGNRPPLSRAGWEAQLKSKVTE